MCEQALKTFLHDMTKNMRNSEDDFKSELISGSMSAIIKQRGIRK